MIIPLGVLNIFIYFNMPKKKRSGAYSKNKGNAYERQIVNELKELFDNEGICTARSASKKLDDMKIDIMDEDGVMPCYFQLKKTQTTPSVKKINAEVGLTDKPLCILWNIQQKKEGNTNITSMGEYAIIPKQFFYELLDQGIKEESKDISTINNIVEAMAAFINDMPTGFEPIMGQMDMDYDEFSHHLDDLRTYLNKQ